MGAITVVDRWEGIRSYRVVAVIANLDSGRVQIGSGYLITRNQVLTARHCIVDKKTGRPARSLQVVRRSDGAEASATPLAATTDVAVLTVSGQSRWTFTGSFARPVFGRVDRSQTGELPDCQAVGFPLWELNPREHQLNGAELHGTIRLTEDVESGLLVMRDPGLIDVSVPTGVTTDQGGERSPWDGLSGALVFYGGVAVGVIIEHHLRQGRSAITIFPVERLVWPLATGDPDTAAVAAALRLPLESKLPVVGPSSESFPYRRRSAPTKKAFRSRPRGFSVYDALPIEFTSFVGREAELSELQRLVRRSRLTTIVGVGGGGKTRLALQLAKKTAKYFDDGVYFIQLDKITSNALVCSEIVRSLKLREQSRKSALEVIVDALRSKEELLILDTCEQVIEACAEVVTALLENCPLLAILCTSRQSIGTPGEAVWRVPSLSLPIGSTIEELSSSIKGSDAVRLFMERAKARDPAFVITSSQLPLLADLCRKLNGIPLAIELAASWVSALDLTEIFHLLSNQLQFFGGQGGRPGRHRTLQSTLDWSYELLSEDQRILFQRVSAFAGGETLAAIKSVCSDQWLEPDRISLIVSELVDRSLLEPKTVEGVFRYYSLDPIREYAKIRLMSSGDADQVSQRYVHFEDY